MDRATTLEGNHMKARTLGIALASAAAIAMIAAGVAANGQVVGANGVILLTTVFVMILT